MIGSVSIKTVDASEFDENVVHQKNEIEEEGYMGGKVGWPDDRQGFFLVCFFTVIYINTHTRYYSTHDRSTSKY